MMPAHDVAKYFVSLVDEKRETRSQISSSRSCSITRRAGTSRTTMSRCFQKQLKPGRNGPVVPSVYRHYKAARWRAHPS